ncbi:hypothetical protein NDU88_004745 [Pleurodeles waltl]|uniref:Uncharacterized protein n=1 Tax=Pleurodeles waltl TaxID=8319 RepID=A0AAV7RHQ6_PLEWA|nr:hypothetical protein NDU88_004745 [Pleurodeles waltl]
MGLPPRCVCSLSPNVGRDSMGAGNPALNTPPGRLSSPVGAASVSAGSQGRGGNTALPAPVSKSSPRRPGRLTGSRATRLQAPSRPQRRRKAPRPGSEGSRPHPPTSGSV